MSLVVGAPNPTRSDRVSHRPGNLGRAGRWVSATALTVLVLGPIYWVGMSAFKPRSEITNSATSPIPLKFTLSNFTRLFATTDYTLYLSNSLIVSLSTTVVSTILSLAAAYGLYRIKFPGDGLVAGIILVAYLIPGTLLIVPLYKTFSSLGLVDTYTGLVLVNVAFTAPFCTWLLRGFILSVPRELDDAAAIDGAGPLRIMTKIVLPLVAPGIATVGVFSFVYSWTEFVFSSQLIVGDSLKTLPLGLRDIVGRYSIDWGLVMAGTAFTMVPTIVVFIIFGKYFVGGLIAGATK